MSYMVMECHPGFAVVLSDDGRFLKVANMRYEVGQTVTDVIPLQLPETQAPPVKKKTPRWLSTAAALAACMLLTVTGLFWNNTPYASVYMAINPEVRIDVNRSDKVVGVEGVNLDGKDLLDGYSHGRKDLDTVVDELVDRAIDMGYLHEGGKITLSLDGDENWMAGHEGTIDEKLNSHLQDKLTVTIDVNQKAVTEATVPTYSGGPIQIPVDPETDYGASDYDDEEDHEGDSGYDDDHEDDDGNSSYDDDDDDDGISSYHDDDDGQTNYGASSYDSGKSDYEDSDDDEDDDDDEDEDSSDYASSQSQSPAQPASGQKEGKQESKDKSSDYEEEDDDDDDEDDSDYDKK